jgi:hypothetical protein
VSRAIPDPGFAGDDGSADPDVVGALAAYATGRVGDPVVLAALAKARLLVPVVALLVAESAVGPDGLRREKATDMALVTLTGGDGRRALPAFTSLEALHRWNPAARPVPAEARRVCLAALTENADLVVIDPSGPVTYRIEGPALRALAAGREPVPALQDTEVVAVVRAAVEAEPALAAAYLFPADSADFVLGLVLGAGADERPEPEVAREVAGRIAAALADEPVLRERLDRGMELAVLPAGTRPRGAYVLLKEPV